MAFSLQQLQATTKCLPPFCLETSGPPASLSLASMSNSNSERRKRQNEGVKLRLRAFHVLRLQEATTHNEDHNEGHGAVPLPLQC